MSKLVRYAEKTAHRAEVANFWMGIIANHVPAGITAQATELNRDPVAKS